MEALKLVAIHVPRQFTMQVFGRIQQELVHLSARVGLLDPLVSCTLPCVQVLR